MRHAMSPHWMHDELDLMRVMESKGKTPLEIHEALASKRAHRGVAVPALKRFRKALRGATYRRSTKETRGRKQKCICAHDHPSRALCLFGFKRTIPSITRGRSPLCGSLRAFVGAVGAV